MMISSETYIEEKRNWTLQELYKEREQLRSFIKEYEERSSNEEENDIIISPSPEVRYRMYKEEYLPELEKLIAEKEQKNS